MTQSNAYLYRMPAGIAGDITRAEHATVKAELMDTDYPVTRYGEPVKMVSGKARPFTTGDTITDLYGFGVRPFPTQASLNEAIAAATPSTTLPLDVMRRGYMTVFCQYGSPAKGGDVYVRTVAADDPTAQPIGGIETGADGGDCTVLTGAIFEGTADDYGFVEISYNI